MLIGRLSSVSHLTAPSLPPPFPPPYQALLPHTYTMALVNLTNIVVLDNPTSSTNPITFEVTFECVQELEDGTWLVVVV